MKNEMGRSCGAYGWGEGVYRVLVGKPEGKRPLGRPRRRWVDNIRTDLQQVGCGYMDWIGPAQNRDRWRTPVSAVMNLRVQWNAGNFLTSCKPVSFSRRILHHGVSKLMRTKWDPIKYYCYCTLIAVLGWPEDGRSRPKHVAKYNLIVIIASCLMYVVYWRCMIYYTFWLYTTGWRLSLSLKKKIEYGNFLVPSKFYTFGSCHHGMARPEVADRGTASDMEGSCKYNE